MRASSKCSGAVSRIRRSEVRENFELRSPIPRPEKWVWKRYQALLPGLEPHRCLDCSSESPLPFTR